MVQVCSSIIATAGLASIAVIESVLNLGPLETPIATVLRKEELPGSPLSICGLCPNNNNTLPVTIKLVSNRIFLY